jgi:hypothetical protein
MRCLELWTDVLRGLSNDGDGIEHRSHDYWLRREHREVHASRIGADIGHGREYVLDPFRVGARHQ